MVQCVVRLFSVCPVNCQFIVSVLLFVSKNPLTIVSVLPFTCISKNPLTIVSVLPFTCISKNPLTIVSVLPFTCISKNPLTIVSVLPFTCISKNPLTIVSVLPFTCISKNPLTIVSVLPFTCISKNLLTIVSVLPIYCEFIVRLLPFVSIKFDLSSYLIFFNLQPISFLSWDNLMSLCCQIIARLLSCVVIGWLYTGKNLTGNTLVIIVRSGNNLVIHW